MILFLNNIQYGSVWMPIEYNNLMMQQSFSSSPGIELDSSLSTSYSYPEPSLMDISISTISTKAAKIKDSLWNYFGIEKILERQDPRYEELIEYSESILPEMTVYYKNQKSKEENKIQATRDVEECYKAIPPKYFSDSFELVLARKKAQESKLAQSEYLDQIDVTLFSIVNANFSKYMAPMMEIQEMDRSTESLLKRINKGRDQLMKMENQFVYKAIKTRKMAYISHNLSKLVTALKYIQKVKDLPNKINKCIEEGKCDYEIFAQLEQTREEERICKQLECLNGTAPKLAELKEELTMFLVGLVDSSLYRYINGLLIYSRDKWSDQGLSTPSNQQLEFNSDITILNETQIDFKETQDIQQDPLLRKELIEMIKLCSKLGIGIGKFGRKLAERLQNFAQGFQQDLNEYLLQTLNIVNNQHVDLTKCFQKIEVKYFVKLCLSYFNILKNLFSKMVELYNYGNQSIQFDQILNPFRLFIIEQIKLLMSYKKLSPDVDAEEFSSYLGLMDFWISAENEEIPELELSVLEDTKRELLGIYLKNFNEVTINGELRETIRADTFQPSSIPADYYVQFQHMFNPTTADQSLMLENTFNRSSRKEKVKAKDMKSKSSNSVRLLNKEISINGESYRVCSSFLLLLEIIEEYGEMSSNLKNCQALLQTKTLEVVGFFNDETRRMLLNREIVKYKTLPQVSLRHLCLLARVLCFLKLILSKLCFKDSSAKHSLEESITLHINDICKEVSTVVVCNVDNEVMSLYQSGQTRNVLGKKAPCLQSQKIVQVLTKVKSTLFQYWDLSVSRQILKPGLKSIEGLYFKALKNQSERGREEIRWVMVELEVNLGKGFEQDLRLMGSV